MNVSNFFFFLKYQVSTWHCHLSFLLQGEHGKRTNLESASEEEIRRQANLLRKEIDEATERVR
jgi:hypothetical protein